MTLLVVGALHWDVVVRAPRLPELDESLRGDAVAYQIGGKGGNQALAAARAGASVSFAGRVGSDPPGATMRDALAQAGVDVSQLQEGAGASGMSAAIVTQTGEYGAVIVSAENHTFDPSRLEIPVGCSTMLLQNEMAANVFDVCVSAARGAGVHVIWNAAPAIGLPLSAFSTVDTLVVNRLEAEQILGCADEEAPLEVATALAEVAPHASVILTLGAGGVVFKMPGSRAQWRPAAAVEVVSAHGAGDVFVGTFAAEQLHGRDFETAVAAGQAAAAAHISQIR